MFQIFTKKSKKKTRELYIFIHFNSLFTKHGAPKSILVQSPKACDGDSCLNMANFQSSANNNNNKKKNGKLLGTMSIVTTSHVKDSIYCAAGAQVLY